MNREFSVVKWVIQIFSLSTFVILIAFYIRWFRLTPWVFFDDPTTGFAFGMILLIIYGFLVKAVISSKDIFTKTIPFIFSILLLGINCLYLEIHIPRLVTTAKCNGIRYYISHYAPIGDEQLSFNNLSRWKGLSYESRWHGYSFGRENIICDEEKQETNFVEPYNQQLKFTDGENPRIYNEYSSAKLRGHRYYISREFSIPEGCDPTISKCEHKVTYTLYNCQLNYTSCNPLPIHYTTDISPDSLLLRADRATNEISLIRQRPRYVYDCQDNKYLDGRKTLIFTYGENPRCYVDGCSILDQ